MKLQQHIGFETAKLGGKLLHHYLDGNSELENLYAFTPDVNGIRMAVEERKKFPINRKVLNQVLHRQHAKNPISEAQTNNLSLLLQENTFTITTGHQLNLFTGPLYFIYKIASAISTAQKMNDEMPGNHFVPVYWMNSEDHDFKEINHFFIDGEKYEWETELSRFGPVGRMSTRGLEIVLKEIETKLTGRSGDESLIDFIIYTYQQSTTLCEAHRAIVNKLFGEYGLVILDQDDVELKKLFAEHMVDEVKYQYSFSQVNKSNDILKHLGFEPQVFVREINLFFITNESRERLMFENGRYFTANNSKSWTKAELENEIRQSPQHFSPNVVTRPLFQEVILPDVAYIGGGAEVAYWLQYKSNFNSRNIFYPVLLLRDSFLLLSENRLNKFDKLGYRVTDLFAPVDELINHYLQKFHTKEFDLSVSIKAIQEHYNTILNQVIAIDSSMDSMVKASAQKALNDLERIESKVKKALKTKHDQQINILKQLHENVQPNGIFQERILNVFNQPIPVADFIRNIINQSDCLDTRIKVLTY